ncbi:MAG TPA: pentapeptide repeat-containing protein [Syntrophorhabdaceae bacterium]|nr:pentapeptide repeat-containing protein [Syntrophorhabdaceae bacterium]
MRKTAVLLMVLIIGSFMFLPGDGLSFNPQDMQKLNTTNKCNNCDLSKANLAGIDLYGANLAGANLSGANLKGTIFGDADLNGANLQGATADKETNFSGAKLSNTIWMDGKKCKAGSIGKCK